MRSSCSSCGRKHLAQALVLMLEAKKGYPYHAWIAVGHMSEAEDELLAEYQDLADQIRAHRLKYMDGVTGAGPEYHVPVMDLIEALCDTDGDVPSVVEVPDTYEDDSHAEDTSDFGGEAPPD